MKEHRQRMDIPGAAHVVEYGECRHGIEGSLYRAIFDVAGTAIVLVDSDANILLANPCFENLSGYARAELEGRMNLNELFVEGGVDRLLPGEAEGDFAQCELALVNRAREHRDLFVTASRIPGTETGLYVISCIDITDRKATELTLRQSEQNYRNILETIQEAYYEVDLDGNFTFFNSRVGETLGCSQEQLKGMNFHAYTTPEDARRIYDTYHRVYVTGEPASHVEFSVVRTDGTVVPVEASVSLRKDAKGRVVGFKGVVRDVSRRKAYEEALRQSEERYRLLAENSSDVIWTLSLDGVFTYLSPSARLLSGYEPSELVGKRMEDVLSMESASRMRKVLSFELSRNPDLRGRFGTFEMQILTKDGQVKDIEVSTSWILDDKGNPIGLQGSGRDITERKRAEEELRRSEERYRNILESIQEGYYEVDLAGRFTFMNTSVCTILGFTPDELLGVKYTKYVSSDDVKKIYEVFHNVYLTGKPDTGFDWQVVRPDGSTRIIETSIELKRDDEGNPCGFRGMVRDVTERKAAEEALRRSEERFRDLAELLPETVYEASLDGCITFVNKAGLEQFGYTEEEVASGLTIDRIVHPSEHRRLKENLALVLEGKKTGLNEYLVVRKDASVFSGLAHSAPITREGRVVGIRGFLVDITEKKNLEARLLHAQRMEAIGTLAGGVAHDFNNLLMGILGNISLAMKEADETSRLYERLCTMEEYVRRASELTQRLLGFAREGKYEVKVTNMAEFVSASVDMFARTHRELRVHLNVGPNIAPVEVDRTQMEQVLLNIFMNAHQAMPGGGDMSVTVENCILGPPHAAMLELEPGRYVTISVTDTGQGMDEETLARVFDPFFTTKTRSRGAGLGLASVYGIVKNHGGSVAVRSIHGVGTEFTVYLPASKKTIGEEKPRKGVQKRGTGCLLLIDDEEMILEVGSEMLSLVGYKVITAKGGKEGIEKYQRSKDEIDLVILDMIMPDLSGRDVYVRLKELDPCVKVLLSSGYALNSQAREIMEMGCSGFIQKPYKIEDITTKIQEILSTS